jgi:hypothetical protein
MLKSDIIKIRISGDRVRAGERGGWRGGAASPPLEWGIEFWYESGLFFCPYLGFGYDSTVMLLKWVMTGY